MVDEDSCSATTCFQLNSQALWYVHSDHMIMLCTLVKWSNIKYLHHDGYVNIDITEQNTKVSYYNYIYWEIIIVNLWKKNRVLFYFKRTIREKKRSFSYRNITVIFLFFLYFPENSLNIHILRLTLIFCIVPISLH